MVKKKKRGIFIFVGLWFSSEAQTSTWFLLFSSNGFPQKAQTILSMNGGQQLYEEYKHFGLLSFSTQYSNFFFSKITKLGKLSSLLLLLVRVLKSNS